MLVVQHVYPIEEIRFTLISHVVVGKDMTYKLYTGVSLVYKINVAVLADTL